MRKAVFFRVDELKLWVNERLADDNLEPQHKHGLANALEHVLHRTNNYNGFGYKYKDDVRPCIPGKVGDEACNPEWTEVHEYRRQYF